MDRTHLKYRNKNNMTQYISKSDLVAEIEKLIDKGIYSEVIDSAYYGGKNAALYALKRYIDALEVKEVDINKEISQFIDTNFEKAKIGHKLSLRRVAKHFFELGLKAQIGEEAWDIAKSTKKM